MNDDESTWALRIAKYQKEEPITTILEIINKPKYVFDDSVDIELRSYYIFIQKNETRHKAIRGPADFEIALQLFEEIQTKKDRISEMLLTYQRIANDLERLKEVAKVHIILKPEVQNARNDATRLAVVSRTIPELEDLLTKVNGYVQSAELLTKNMNKTFDILAAQTDTVKQMMYWRNLTLPSDKQSLKLER